MDEQFVPSAFDGMALEDDDDYEPFREQLKDTYGFYVMNPTDTNGTEYSFWVEDDGIEFPVIQSNTGGFVTFNSRGDSVGDSIEPTDSFLNLVWMAVHEALCFMPDMYFRGGHFEESMNTAYDGKPREYEAWTAKWVASWMLGEQTDLIAEIQPIVRWAQAHTEMTVPVAAEMGIEVPE